MLRLYLRKKISPSYRFYKRDSLKRLLMRLIKVFVMIFLFLPACRTTRDTVIPHVRGSESQQVIERIYAEEIAMKFPEPESKAPGEQVRRPAPEKAPGQPESPEPAGETPEVEVDLPENTAVSERDAAVWLSEEYLESLTLEQKIGQRFIAHLQGTELSKQVERMISDEYVAGFIIYPWNVKSSDQVKSLTASMQRTALGNDPSIQLFICVDQEGGRVNAFKLNEVSRFPAPYYWAQYDDPQFVESAAYIISKEISELGCNMNFAPVLDVYGIPDKTVIGDRSMGSDPEAVGRYGISYIRGASKAGIIPVMKHFPGHGYTAVDSHHKLPVVRLEEAELHAWDMKPFKMAIEQGADAVMTSHVLYSNLDPHYPATLSSHILRNILREQYGFRGVIVSDGIAMGAISNNYDVTETLKLSFKAGIDLILVHSSYDLSDLKKRVHRLYRRGEINDEDIDEGVRRVLALKLKYGLLPESLPDV
jgi:beta-N-acetylhexosaminidase